MTDVAPAGGFGGPPDGTIVVATRDRAERVVPTIERLLALPEAWPVIVIDDASHDDTFARLRRRFGTRIHLIRLARNLGAAARNVGVRAAATEFVAFADDDSWWEPGALATAAEAMHRHTDVALVAAAVRIAPDSRPDPIVTEFASSALPHHPAGPTVMGFLACGAVVRRSAFIEVGGFHPLLQLGAEELLLAIDLRAAGWRLVHVDRVVAHHDPDMSDAGREGRSARILRNRVLIAVMRRPAGSLLAELGELRRAGRDGDVRRAAVGCIRRIPRALACRRRIPRSVEDELRLVGI